MDTPLAYGTNEPFRDKKERKHRRREEGGGIQKKNSVRHYFYFTLAGADWIDVKNRQDDT